MYGALDISTSGMTVQRARMASIAANIANRSTILDEKGNVNPYRARQVVFAPGDPQASSPEGRALGVHVAGIQINQGEFNYRWDPTNPYAIKKGEKTGYVPEPNINPVIEQLNAMEASRAYEANVVAAETTKQMMAQALRLLA
ncbi:MAG: flagellar basal body rod protein FlgC [Phycisphaerales bacterium]|nr:flagellar basal body rod protein FlgC [Phycisphaerales bacterium]